MKRRVTMKGMVIVYQYQSQTCKQGDGKGEWEIHFNGDFEQKPWNKKKCTIFTMDRKREREK